MRRQAVALLVLLVSGPFAIHDIVAIPASTSRERLGWTDETQLVPDDSVVRIAWVIRDRDCATCASPAYIWRRTKALFGDSVQLVAFVIGPDTQAVRAVFRDERIAAHIAIVRPDGGGKLVSPSMLLLNGRRIKNRWTQATRPTFVRLMAEDSGSVLIGAVRAELAARRSRM